MAPNAVLSASCAQPLREKRMVRALKSAEGCMHTRPVRMGRAAFGTSWVPPRTETQRRSGTPKTGQIVRLLTIRAFFEVSRSPDVFGARARVQGVRGRSRRVRLAPSRQPP